MRNIVLILFLFISIPSIAQIDSNLIKTDSVIIEYFSCLNRLNNCNTEYASNYYLKLDSLEKEKFKKVINQNIKLGLFSDSLILKNDSLLLESGINSNRNCSPTLNMRAILSEFNSKVENKTNLYQYPAGQTIYVSFICEKDGKITNCSIIKGTNEIYDYLILKGFNNCPYWIPARNNKGELIRVKMTLPIKIRLI